MPLPSTPSRPPPSIPASSRLLSFSLYLYLPHQHYLSLSLPLSLPSSATWLIPHPSSMEHNVLAPHLPNTHTHTHTISLSLAPTRRTASHQRPSEHAQTRSSRSPDPSPPRTSRPVGQARIWNVRCGHRMTTVPPALPVPVLPALRISALEAD